MKNNYQQFSAKFYKEFPTFNARKVENEFDGWDNYLESAHFQKITQCSDIALAYLIKDTEGTRSIVVLVASI